MNIASLRIKFILLQWLYNRNTIWGRICVTHYFDKIGKIWWMNNLFNAWNLHQSFSSEKNYFVSRLKFLKKKLINDTKDQIQQRKKMSWKFYHIKYVGVIYNICWIPGKLWQGTKVDCNLLLCYANDNKHSRMGTKHNVYDL